MWAATVEVCTDPTKDAVCADHHSDADNEGYGADHDPSQELNVGEQAQWHKKIEDNPHYQNRERDQRGEDQDIWRIAGGIGHGVVRLAWSISVRGTSTNSNLHYRAASSNGTKLALSNVQLFVSFLGNAERTAFLVGAPLSFDGRMLQYYPL